MKFGINILARGVSFDICEIGRKIEAAGFDSLFLPEHTHIPVHGDMHAGGPDVQKIMMHLPDPYACLTAVAAVTSTLKIGTGISLIAQHDPIAMAKRIATIDQISRGRFMLGIGSGWNRSEAGNHGVAAQNRWAVLREHVLAMKKIWTDDQAEFHGTFVDFEPLYSWPKPATQPHPPIIVGGEGPGVLERVLAFGDMWGPHPVPGVTNRIEELQCLARQAGRPQIPVTLFNVAPDPETIQSYAEAGVERCVLYIYDEGPGTIENRLEAYSAFVRDFVNGRA